MDLEKFLVKQAKLALEENRDSCTFVDDDGKEVLVKFHPCEGCDPTWY